LSVRHEKRVAAELPRSVFAASWNEFYAGSETKAATGTNEFEELVDGTAI